MSLSFFLHILRYDIFLIGCTVPVIAERICDLCIHKHHFYTVCAIEKVVSLIRIYGTKDFWKESKYSSYSVCKIVDRQ